MKIIGIVALLLFFVSCSTAKVVTMPYRNYDISAERLMPLLYCESMQSIRIWISRSTSIDQVLTVTQAEDLSMSAFSIELGQMFFGANKFKRHYTQTSIQPVGGINDFFQRLDSLQLFQYNDQKEIEHVLHQTVDLIIVEYLKEQKYIHFRFQAGQSDYKKVEDFIAREFGMNKSSN